ncbi:subclass B3 metallo-beta-lactamase BJP-1 [Chitinophaga terrae (ex Kim and Jung 2007)]|nr:subclass B3 metallo-beta-lactamase BJP-1 [Chitinophaga terrae (ex Kim and Jung 2007)]
MAQKVVEPKGQPDWVKPYQPFRIAGNLYYVGTYDLACYLIVTPAGNILINTGLASSVNDIKKNIKALGFKFEDTKILLTTQAHYDHLGAMAAIKEETGAKFFVDAADAEEVASGGKTDYALGGQYSSFKPVKADKLLKDKDSVVLGGTTLVMLHHPGHTKGSCSYLLNVKDDKKTYKVLIANLPSIVTEQKFKDIRSYPGIAKDYAYTINSLKHQTFDIWVASHASQFKLHEKHKPGDAYNPAAFRDEKGYKEEVKFWENEFKKKLAKE